MFLLLSNDDDTFVESGLLDLLFLFTGEAIRKLGIHVSTNVHDLCIYGYCPFPEDNGKSCRDLKADIQF